tara:strand:+ start:366 stop:530 length:165 start_codon:yes stop_codon:yes gene_type:complete
MNGKLAAFAAVECGGDGDFDTELIRPVSLALADAFNFGGVQGINLLRVKTQSHP